LNKSDDPPRGARADRGDGGDGGDGHDGQDGPQERRGQGLEPARVVRPALAVFGGSAVALLSSLAVRAIAARALGPSDLGRLLLAVAIATAWGSAAGLGLNPAAARRVAGHLAAGRPEQARRTARTALAVATGAGVLALVALLAAAAHLAGWLGEGDPTGSLAGALLAIAPIAPIAFSLPVGAAMLGISRGFSSVAGRAWIRDAGGGVLRLGAVATAASLGGGLFWVAAGFTLGTVAGDGLFVAWGLTRGWLRRAAAGLDRQLFGGLVPLALIGVLQPVESWMDMLVMGALAPAAAVGIYGIARGIFQALSMLQLSAAHAYLPAAAAAWKEGALGELRRLDSRTRLTLVALLWMPVTVCALAPEIPIEWLGGPAYRSAAPILRLLAAAVLVDALFGYRDLALVACEREKAAAGVRLAAAGLGLLLLGLAVPRFGGIGAAGALTVAICFRAATAAALLRRTAALPVLEWTIAGPVAKAALPAAAAALGVTAMAAPLARFVVAMAAGALGLWPLLAAIRTSGVQRPAVSRRQ